MAGRIGRRTFIRDVSMAAAGMSLGPLARTSWAAKPVSLFFGYPYTGPYASLAKFMNAGMELAVEQFGGMVLDRPIRVVRGDIPSPDVASKVVRRAVDELGCKLLTVAPSSATALAASGALKRKKAVLMAHGGSDSITGSACSPNTFRWQVPTWGAVRAVVPLVQDQYGARTFYAITPDYIFGEDLLRNSRQVLYERSGVLLGNSYHRIGEQNFSESIAKAKDSGAECILLLNFGDDTVRFLEQAYAAGLSRVSQIACVWGAGIYQMSMIDPAIVQGVFWGLQYYHTIATEANRAFARAHKAKFRDVPTYLAAAVYSTTAALLRGVEQAGTDEPSEVIKAIEGHRYAGLTGREEYRECDHQCVKPFYVVRCNAVEGKVTPYNLADIVGNSLNLQPCGANGCNL